MKENYATKELHIKSPERYFKCLTNGSTLTKALSPPQHKAPAAGHWLLYYIMVNPLLVTKIWLILQVLHLLKYIVDYRSEKRKIHPSIFDSLFQFFFKKISHIPGLNILFAFSFF